MPELYDLTVSEAAEQILDRRDGRTYRRWT